MIIDGLVCRNERGKLQLVTAYKVASSRSRTRVGRRKSPKRGRPRRKRGRQRCKRRKRGRQRRKTGRPRLNQQRCRRNNHSTWRINNIAAYAVAIPYKGISL